MKTPYSTFHVTTAPNIHIFSRPRFATLLNRLAPGKLLLRMVVPGLLLVAVCSLALSYHFSRETQKAFQTLHQETTRNRTLLVEKKILTAKHIALKEKSNILARAQADHGLDIPGTNQLRTIRR